MMYYMEQNSICLFAICICLMKCLLRSLAQSINCISLLLLSFKYSSYIFIVVLYHICPCKYFLSVCSLSSHSLDIFFFREEIFFYLIREEIFNVNKIQLVNDYFHWLCFRSCVKKSSSYSKSSEFPPKFYSRCFIKLCFAFRSLIILS